MNNALKKLFHNDPELKDVIKGSTGIVLIRTFALILSFLMSILIARYLGVTQYGVYTYAYTVATLLALVSLLGLDRYSMRETAVAFPLKQWSKIKGIKHSSEIYILATSLLLSIITIVLYSKLVLFENNLTYDAIPYILFLTPLIALIRLESGILRGLKKVVRSQLADNIYRPLGLILLLIVLNLNTYNASGSSIIIAHSLASFIALLWLFFELKKSLPGHFSKIQPDYEFGPQFRASLSLGGIAVLGGLANQIPLLILGSYQSAAELGAFAAAMRLAQLTTFTYAAVNMALGPTMARIYRTGDKRRMSNISQLTAILSFLLSIPVALVFFFFSSEILSIYGVGFDRAHRALEILVVLQLIHVSVGSVALWLMMSSKENYALLAQGMSFIFTLFVSYFLIPEHGPEGAAIAYASGLLLYNILCAGLVMKILGFNPTCYGFVIRNYQKAFGK